MSCVALAKLSLRTAKVHRTVNGDGRQYQAFHPPQVIRMACADNALAIVKWYAQRKDVFPTQRKDYIAMAQVQGRTVFLNANDNSFAVARNDLPLPPQEVSLITVFVHELGHSFGLPDRTHSIEPSVMDPDYVTQPGQEAFPDSR